MQTCYLSALDRSAARVKAQLLTCPPAYLGLLIWGSRAGRAEPAWGLLAWKESLCIVPRGRAAHSQGSSLGLLGPGKMFLPHGAFGGAVEVK